MDKDVAGLVEKLEIAGVAQKMGVVAWEYGLADKAASTIHTLVAENEQLTAELASCRRLYNDLYSGEFAEIATKLRVSDALLREAVKWVREARKWCQEGLSGQHDRLAEQALERIHEATGDFLATMEKPHDP